MGTGRLEELKGICELHDVELIIADGELTPTQRRNIEDQTDVRVIDRTMLILDIFAMRALSREGKLQVELAQLKYTLVQLTGKGTQLSRLGGGIGTRGPGETKLESDRRHIRRRVDALEAELADLSQRRQRYRERRKKEGFEVVSLVGYTNSGKSTLMNTLTGAGVLAENKLFATLDPTARALKLPDGRTVMLIDTVGFIRRLPHRLIDAFKSTLDEAIWADVILNVCDASSGALDTHIEVTQQLLGELGCAGKPVINVLNKCDLPEAEDLYAIGESVRISALTGEGVQTLLEKIVNALPNKRRRATLFIPYSMGTYIDILRREGVVHEQKNCGDGYYIDVTADVVLLERLKDYIV